ncbi:outer membrane beta-barrel protein [Agaribacterium haliotis]|uniref:outer membrane beta-barrel protein n=1 Tax=Agaribacterium haliotis TaxID=2013869 RepID=UPI000BB56A7E|nr:outer membrane beta-barrel protein [Agaribacterium haliotis]
MIRPHLVTCAAVTVFLSSAVQADVKQPSWDFFSISYDNVSASDSDFRPSGFGLLGASSIGQKGVMYARYQRSDDEVAEQKLELEQIRIAAGGSFDNWEKTDIYGLVGYSSRELEGIEDRREDGLTLSIGVRSLLFAELELGATAHYIDYSEGGESELDLSAQYYFSDGFSVGLLYQSADDYDTTSAQISIHY